MKTPNTVKNAILWVVIVISLSACADGLLSPTPRSEITVKNFYNDQADIEKAVSGVYGGMKEWPVTIYLFLSEIRSKNYVGVAHDAQEDWWDITTFNVRSQTNILADVWGNLYQVINRANRVLEYIDEVPFEEPQLKSRFEAEVRFLRALSYFQLVRLFGRVPLVTEVITADEGTEIGQSEPAEVYDFIIQEMSEVQDQLPAAYADEEIGRVTRWAAKGILARVYLTMAGYPLRETANLDEAQRLLKEIIDQEGRYVTFPDSYEEAFPLENYVFEIQFTSGGRGTGTSLPAHFLPPDISSDIVPFGGLWSATRLAISEDLLSSYTPGDARFSVTIDTFYVTNDVPPDTGNTPYFHKFLDPGAEIVSRDDWPADFPLLRYADVLLMYAEVSTELAGTPTPEAVDILNRIRERAGLDPIHPATREEFDRALVRERRLEFAGEGQYWFYLVRSGSAVSVMNGWFQTTGQGIQIDEHNLIYPIPQTEIDISPDLYQQNPGY